MYFYVIENKKKLYYNNIRLLVVAYATYVGGYFTCVNL